MGERIFLIGMMGSGKSTVARLLAHRLGFAVADSDEAIERRAGMRVGEIFAEEGEEAFRCAETEAIATLAAMPGPVVVSVGGGAVLREVNRSTMQGAGTVVWLRARTSTLANRLGAGDGRPLLSKSRAGTVGTLERLVAEREDLYRQASELVVDVDDISPGAVAEKVAAELARLAS